MSSFERLEFLDTEERVKIYEWSERRRKKYRGFRKNLYLQEIFAFDKGVSLIIRLYFIKFRSRKCRPNQLRLIGSGELGKIDWMGDQ